jgi:ParB-like chromosome segregation protein Spo0J
VTAPPAIERPVALTELGDSLASLRLADAPALATMRVSLAHHGQLSPVRAFSSGAGLEVFDGFKRLHAARGLGLGELRAVVVDEAAAEAVVHIRELHSGRGLTALEEAWIVRALYRDYHLSQGTIAARLRCHKTWVCRRLMLVEALDPSVQADVRLGLLSPRAAVLVSALPRGNQAPASGVAIRRGLTVRQTGLLVQELRTAADPGAQQAVLARWSEGRPVLARPGAAASRSVAERIALDIATIRRSAGRLEALLVTTPLAALPPGASDLVRQGLGELGGVLRALTRTVDGVVAAAPCSQECA